MALKVHLHESQLLLVRRVQRLEESPLSATAWRGTPLPLAQCGDVTPPHLHSIAGFYCSVAARWGR
jgi:hypothetical protein